MTTLAKHPIVAVVKIVERGRAEVTFPSKGLSGEIRRQGVQSYIAFSGDEIAGHGARYESAARQLANFLGLLRQHIVQVKIENTLKDGS